MYYLSIVLSLFLLISCGSKPEEETRRAIDKAQVFLSTNKCQDAINVLEESGLETTDFLYIQVYASAYACRSGFSELTFFTSDINVLQTSSATELFTTVSLLSTSPETMADSASYTDLLKGINIILNSTGTPSQISRNGTYGERKAGDMGTQALYMLIAQLGKYLNHYGNVDTTGKKGGGASQCFLAYSDATASALADALPATNACQPPQVGNPDLSLAAPELDKTKRRMCEGLMIITNLADILRNIALPTNDSFGDLADVKDLVDDYIDDFENSPDTDFSSLIQIKKQSECEAYIATPAKFGKLQQMYVGIFEANLE